MFHNQYHNISGEKPLKTNYHIHAGIEKENSCGKLPMDAVVSAYAEAKYDAIAVTNHDTFIPIVPHSDIALLKGVEYSHTPHMLLIGVDEYHDVSHQEAIDIANRDGGFVVLSHPNWITPDYWPLEMLDNTTGFLGMEILNPLIFRLSGSGLALDKWDYLLSKGRKVYGFGNDDFHAWQDLDRVSTMVYAKSASFEDIKEAVGAGRFYVANRLKLNYLDIEDGAIKVKAAQIGESHVDSFHYRFIGTGGKLLHEFTGSAAEYKIDSAQLYIRIEVYGEGGALLFTQPLHKAE